MKAYYVLCLKPFEATANGQLYCSPEHRIEFIKLIEKENRERYQQLRAPGPQPSDHDFIRRTNSDETKDPYDD